MPQKAIVLLPRQQDVLEQLGENIRLARLRRKLSTAQVAERSGMTRTTLWHIEKGAPQVAIGAYCRVLCVLGLAQDLSIVATDDELGRRLQDAELIVKKRAPKRPRL